ncbi:hypothetical protein V2J09_004319 [Rumex salicifolius]
MFVTSRGGPRFCRHSSAKRISCVKCGSNILMSVVSQLSSSSVSMASPPCSFNVVAANLKEIVPSNKENPVKLEGNLQAGAIAGYSLLWLLLWATIMGLLIKLLSARVGVATGWALSE